LIDKTGKSQFRL